MNTACAVIVAVEDTKGTDRSYVLLNGPGARIHPSIQSGQHIARVSCGLEGVQHVV